MRVAPVSEFNPGAKRQMGSCAVFNAAAERSLCTAGIAGLVGLEGPIIPTERVGATGTADEGSARYVSFRLRGYRTPERYLLEAYALSQMTDLRDHIPRADDITRNLHLHGLEIPEHKRRRVDILISVGEPHLHHVFDTRCGNHGQLWAALTGLGWVLHGRDSRVCDELPLHVNTCQSRRQGLSSPRVGRGLSEVSRGPQLGGLALTKCEPQGGSDELTEGSPVRESEAESTRLLRLVEQQLALDFSEPQRTLDSGLSRREQQMLKVKRMSIKRLPNGRYEEGLWKRSPSILPNNFARALGSLQGLRRRLERNPSQKAQYKEFIEAMVVNTLAEQVPPTGGSSKACRQAEPMGWAPPTGAAPQATVRSRPYSISNIRKDRWCLLHHPVGLKFGVVFNGAATPAGYSLNACLDKGSENSGTLLGVLLRCRAYAKAVCGDIKGMFLALISEVYPNASDGLVRRVKLRFPGGKQLLRDVRHIALLEAVEGPALEGAPPNSLEGRDACGGDNASAQRENAAMRRRAMRSNTEVAENG